MEEIFSSYLSVCPANVPSRSLCFRDSDPNGELLDNAAIKRSCDGLHFSAWLVIQDSDSEALLSLLKKTLVDLQRASEFHPLFTAPLKKNTPGEADVSLYLLSKQDGKVGEQTPQRGNTECQSVHADFWGMGVMGRLLASTFTLQLVLQIFF